MSEDKQNIDKLKKLGFVSDEAKKRYLQDVEDLEKQSIRSKKELDHYYSQMSKSELASLDAYLLKALRPSR